MPLCDQWCGTAIHFEKDGPHNDRDGKLHVCSQATRAKEFEGYYNMIQIKSVREELNNIEYCAVKLKESISALERRLEWQEQQNKPWAEAFIKRKQKGRNRNNKTIAVEVKKQPEPPIKILPASELIKQ